MLAQATISAEYFEVMYKQKLRDFHTETNKMRSAEAYAQAAVFAALLTNHFGYKLDDLHDLQDEERATRPCVVRARAAAAKHG
jgi:hypothetical protein